MCFPAYSSVNAHPCCHWGLFFLQSYLSGILLQSSFSEWQMVTLTMSFPISIGLPSVVHEILETDPKFQALFSPSSILPFLFVKVFLQVVTPALLPISCIYKHTFIWYLMLGLVLLHNLTFWAHLSSQDIPYLKCLQKHDTIKLPLTRYHFLWC